jgi:hypothetical protein
VLLQTTSRPGWSSIGSDDNFEKMTNSSIWNTRQTEWAKKLAPVQTRRAGTAAAAGLHLNTGSGSSHNRKIQQFLFCGAWFSSIASVDLSD